MKFTFPNDQELVNKLITKLVSRFKENWNEETRRQKDMAKRAREILLRWGCFSEDYVERAELLCDSKSRLKIRRSWILLSVIVCVITPSIAILPFMWSLEGDGEDPSRDSLVVSSVWFANVGAYVEHFVCVCVCVCFTLFLSFCVT